MKRALDDFMHQEADVCINGHRPWDVTIHNDAFFKRIFFNTELILGESYMDGWWDCEKLDQFFHKILLAKLNEKILTKPQFWFFAMQHLLKQIANSFWDTCTVNKSLDLGKIHYDVGNDLYQLMLDKRMVYTCAYWDKANNLDEAQENKLELTCQKLGLKPGMKVLDIGCGFGSFAKYAAEKYQVSVMGITISEQQLILGQKRCEGLPVKLQFLDYRKLIQYPEAFDRVVSLGMFEHVGYKNYAQYMKVVSHCLKPDGLFLLHTIGGNYTDITTNQWIHRYIFPTGHLPSISQIGLAIEKLFIMEDWHNFGVDYDRTLMAWNDNFNQNWDQLKRKYDERFKRMWNFYLLSCAGSFRARINQLWQIVLSKNGLEKGFKR